MSELLNNLMIAAPCSVSWDSMESLGDDLQRVRYCSLCSKNVYNISDMSSQEAESFLNENGVSQCMRFFRRADGTIINDNCPRGLRKIRDRFLKVSALACGLLASALFFIQRGSAQEASFEKFPLFETHRRKPTPDLEAAGGASFAPTFDPPDSSLFHPRIGKPALSTQPKPKPGNTKAIMLGPECSQLDKKEQEAQRGVQIKHVVDKSAVQNKVMHGDRSAFDLWQKGKENEIAGNFALSLTFYQQALRASEAQAHADPKFRMQINSDLKMLKEKLFKQSLAK